MPYREGFGELLADTSRVAWDDAAALEPEILRLGPERVAAFVFEPVIGAGGVLAPPPGYLDEVTAICARHGVLTIADAVIGGFGRVGGVVRGRALRARARPDRLRQGRDQRVPAARRRRRLAACRRAVLDDAGAAVLPRRDLQRPPDLLCGSAREHRRCSSATGSSTARGTLEAGFHSHAARARGASARAGGARRASG